jgi:hypothetical protein
VTPEPVQPPAGELPKAVRSAHGRAQVTLYLLYGGVLVAVLALISGLVYLHILGEIAAGAKLPKGVAEASDTREGLIILLQALLFLMTTVAWLLWQHRAYSNLRLIGSRQTERSPGWSVGYWFIPFLNLVRPYNITAELWHRSESRNAPAQVIPLSGTPLLTLWWLSYLAANMTARVYSSMVSDATAVAQLITAKWIDMVSDALLLIAAVAAIQVIRGIVRFQDSFLEAP